MEATQGWCSCFLFLPALLVHICFPDGKKREGGSVRKRSIGTIYPQRKILTQTFFTFPLRSDLLTYVPPDCWLLCPLTTPASSLVSWRLLGGAVSSSSRRLRVFGVLTSLRGYSLAVMRPACRGPSPCQVVLSCGFCSHRVTGQSPSSLAPFGISHWFLLTQPTPL